MAGDWPSPFDMSNPLEAVLFLWAYFAMLFSFPFVTWMAVNIIIALGKPYWVLRKAVERLNGTPITLAEANF